MDNYYIKEQVNYYALKALKHPELVFKITAEVIGCPEYVSVFILVALVRVIGLI